MNKERDEQKVAEKKSLSEICILNDKEKEGEEEITRRFA